MSTDWRFDLEPQTEPMACRVCRQALTDRDVYVDNVYRRTEWFHRSDLTGEPDPATADGHKADPVPVSQLEVVSVCDFCPNPGPVVAYPCGTCTISVAELVDGGSEGHGFSGGWAACRACADAIDAGYWHIVEARMMSGKPPEAALLMRLILEGFKAHRNGPAGPL